MADTEWNDILREKGIIPEVEISQQQIEEWVDEAIEKQINKPIEDKDLDELDEMLDDDLEDDRIIEKYRKQRMQEMQKDLLNEKYGSVVQISKPDYQKQVTEASKDCFVLVHLFQSYVPDSKLLGSILDRLAQKYKATKFVKIVADLCIENYPDRNVPTLLVYGHGELVKQIVGLSLFGGKSCNLENVEMILKGLGALDKTSHDYEEEETVLESEDDGDEWE